MSCGVHETRAKSRANLNSQSRLFLVDAPDTCMSEESHSQKMAIIYDR